MGWFKQWLGVEMTEKERRLNDSIDLLTRNLERGAELQAEQARQNSELFGKWLAMFEAPKVVEPLLPNRDEHDIVESLEVAAEMGDLDAKDLLADEARLKAHVRFILASR